MLSITQQQQLTAVVQAVRPDLHIDVAQLDAEHTLELVLCRDFVCFRPLRVTMAEVDVPAALAGQPAAQQALHAWLQAALHGML